MTRKPAVKLKLVKTDTVADAEISRRDPRSLRQLDWYAAGILCALMVIAPMVAGDFSTSSGILPIESIWSLFTTIGVPILLILAALAYLPFAWREWTKPVAIGDVNGLAPAFALLVVWASLTAMRTPALYQTVNAVAVLCAVILSAALAGRLARDRTALFAMLVSITVGGTVVAIIGVSEYLSYVALHAPQHRSFSTFSDPNFLAGYLLLTIPIALSLFACSRDVRLRLLAGLAVITQSSALWLSGSRSGSAIVLVEVAVFICLAWFVRISSASSKWIKIGLALFVVGSLPALTPLLSRLHHTPPAKQGNVEAGAGVVSSDAQVNSNEFRRWTWIGTVRMAQANPVLGTGFGAFDLSYARYAETAFTAHAHNSYLQLMAETGYPGVLLVLIGLAAAAAFAAHSLLLYRNRSVETERSTTTNQPADQPYHALVDAPEVVLAGLIAAVSGSMLHNLIDSDWYVAANAFTLAAVVALAVAIARDMAPLSTRRPTPLRKEILAVGAVVALSILWRGAHLASSRMNESLGTTDWDIASSHAGRDETSVTNRNQAAEAFHSAAAADPFDPEPYFGLAEVAITPDERLKALNTALSICKTGKAYYRIGQFYMAEKEWASAYEAFDSARRLEPKMLQNLHALANAYLAAGKTDDAERALQTISALQLTPYGEVRAMHESVETEFAYAHAMLGDMYAKKSDWQSAALQYEMARDVLSEYWIGRHFLVNVQGRTAEKRRELADLYGTVLMDLNTADAHLNKPMEATAAATKLETVRKERAADDDAGIGPDTASSPSTSTSP